MPVKVFYPMSGVPPVDLVLRVPHAGRVGLLLAHVMQHTDVKELAHPPVLKVLLINSVWGQVALAQFRWLTVHQY